MGSTATQITQTLSDMARLTGKGSQYTESGAISVGKGGSYQEAGSLAVSNKGKGDVSLTFGATSEDLKSLGDLFSSTSSGQNQIMADFFKSFQASQSENTGGLLDALKQQSSSLGSTIQDSLNKLAALGQTNQTGGVSELNKTFLWIALGVLGLFAVIFFVGKRR